MFVTHRIRNVYSTKDREWHVSEEIAFHVATTSLSAREYAHGIRAHWGMENKNHHIKDVVLLEDASRIRRNPGSFGRLRSCALNVLRINNVKNINLTLCENALDICGLFAYLGL